MDREEVTRAEFENVLEQLQGPINSRSRGDHTFYNVVRIEDSSRVLSREIGNLLRRTFNLSSGVEVGEEDIDGLLERLGLESRRQGITLSVGAKEKIPDYQLQQIRDHLERAGYTLETVGKS